MEGEPHTGPGGLTGLRRQSLGLLEANVSGIHRGKAQVRQQLQREELETCTEAPPSRRLSSDLAHVNEETTKAGRKTYLKEVGRTITVFTLGRNSLCSHQQGCKDILTHRTPSPTNILRKVLPSRASRPKALLNQPNKTQDKYRNNQTNSK